MTDFRQGNDACVIQHRQQQEQQPQQQQSKPVLRESFHTKCNNNSTPERLQLSTKEQYHTQHQQMYQQQNPLLQSLIDYTHSQHYNGNAGGIQPMNGLQFDEHEIYYVSPTKRKSSLRSTISGTMPIQQQPQKQQERFRISSPVRNTIYCNQTTTTIIPSTVTSTTSAAAAGTLFTTATTTATDYGSRLAGVVHDFSLDDNSSHYSDTAMQVLRSGSISGSIGETNSRYQNFRTAIATTNNNNTNNNKNNNSNSHSSSSSSLATTARFQNNNAMVTFSQTLPQQQPQQHQYHGSLQRNKGRSTQSLCSCDAGNDTEINLDSTRPLYQYDVEGKKTHTYTCEQNAQILMRLERERKRKFSLGADVEIGFGNTMTMTTTGRAKNDTQKSQFFDMDFNNIPPVPPPPILKHHASNLGLQLLQHQQQKLQQQKKKTIDASRNYNDRNSTLDLLCSNDVGSLLDDCTASILKCANTISDELGFSTSPSITGEGVLANTTKENTKSLIQNQIGTRPDTLTDLNKYLQIYGSSTHDDIIMPKSQKSDLNLCFLHAKTNGHDIGGSGIGKSGTAVNVEPDLHIDIDSRRNFNKYNTIGPSSVYAKNWSLYRKQLQVEEEKEQQQQRTIATNHCRCFSKSLSNFPIRSYLDNIHTEFSGLDSGDNQHPIHSNVENEPPSYPPIIEHSFSNLVSHGGQRTSTKTNRFHVPTNVFNTSCNYKVAPKPTINLLNEASFLTLNSSTNSGLNHHLHHQHHHHHNYQEQQQQKQPNVYHKNSPHPYRKQNHQHENSQLHRQYSHHDYLLHNNKANVLGLHKQSTIQNHHNQHHHQHQQQQQHELVLQQQQQQQEKHYLPLPTSVTSLMPWKHRQCPSRCSSSSGTNSLRFDAAKHWLAVSSILLIIGAASVAVPLALRVAASAPFEERLRVAQQLLDQVPLIDGHNDLPWNIRKFLHNKLNDFNFDQDLRSVMPWARSHWSHTDLQRLKKGRVSAQFWAAYVPCEAQHRDAVQLTLEQIDVIKRLTDRYAPQLIACTSSDDIIEAHKKHQMCSLTGVEGGHSLGGSLAVLRTLYAIGVRYMTLTSTCHTPWADSSYADAPTFNVKHGGLTIFGKTIIREMNRLGMMVDLSHVSTGTMRDAMEVSEAPVIFSHSSAYELCNSSRNVQDDTLQSLAKNGGIVMVNFYSRFLSCNENSTVHDAVAHINHIRRVAGVDHVGLGAGFDGINFTPKGLEDVSTYPTLFAELVGVGWTVEDLTKLAGGNFLRVMQRVEKIRDDKRTLGIKPYEDHPNFRTDDPYNCTSS